MNRFLLPQWTMALIETAFNALVSRSPHIQPLLRKLDGSVLQLTLAQPDARFFIVFSANRTDWLSEYEGEADCAVQLAPSALPHLADKSRLSDLINNKSLIIQGNIEVLQHFSALLDGLEKNPAELLSPFIGDVAAQLSTDVAKNAFGKFKQQLERNSRDWVDNLTTERALLVHPLQLADFSDQVQQLAQQVSQLEQRVAKLR